MLTALARPKEALPLLNTPLPPDAGLAQLEVRRLIDFAAVVPADEGPALIARAKISASDPELRIRASLAEGIANRFSHPEVAQARYLEGLQLAETSGNRYYRAVTLNNLSYSSKSLRHYEDAVKYATQAVDLAESLGARRIAALAHGNLGSACFFLGDYEAAFRNQRMAIPYYESVNDRLNLMIALGEIGIVYDATGDFEKAIASYSRAFQIASDLNRDRDAERHAGNLALSWLKSKNWDRAEEWNQKAFQLASRAADQSSIPYLNRNRARIAYELGRCDEAIRICNDLLRDETKNINLRWEAFATMGASYEKCGNVELAKRYYENALETIDRNSGALADSQFRMTLLSSLFPFYWSYVGLLIERGDQAAAIRIAESSRARVLTERTQRGQRSKPFPDLASLEAVARSTGSTILSFWLAPLWSYAWLITPDAVRPFRLPAAGEIEKRVTAYRNVVEHSLKDPILTNDPAGPDLWNVLMGEIGPAIPKGSHVIVIPDGALHRLNLETLVVPTPAPHYWIEDVSIAVAPSITVAAMPEAGSPPARKSLLLIGAPDYSGSGFEPLKNAGREVSEVSARFGAASREVIGTKAVPDAYKAADPGNYSYIHFTAHAEADAQNPLSSAVILSGSPNRLFARDVIDIPLHADLVTISACKSAGVRSYAGEGLIGFAWAFLRAGARHVVAGLWDVSDSSTEPLMDRFYGAIAAGQDPVDALHSAKLALRRDLPHFRKPFYWAPFQTYIASAGKASEKD